MFVVITK